MGIQMGILMGIQLRTKASVPQHIKIASNSEICTFCFSIHVLFVLRIILDSYIFFLLV